METEFVQSLQTASNTQLHNVEGSGRRSSGHRYHVRSGNF